MKRNYILISLIFSICIILGFSSILSLTNFNMMQIQINKVSGIPLRESAYLLWQEDGVEICGDTNVQQQPVICSDGKGGAIIAWSDFRGDPVDIYAQRINSTGDIDWVPDGVIVCAEAFSQFEPQIISDGANGSIIHWFDYRDVFDNIFLQRINSSGIRQWTVSGVSLLTSTDEPLEGQAQSCSDGASGCIITWVDDRNGDYDLFAQRFESDGSRNWTTNGVDICNISSNTQIYPDICSDGTGGAIITWVNMVDNDNYDIYAQRINSDGVTQWTDNGTPICTFSGRQNRPKICSDGNNGAIITWQDEASHDIYAQRINSTGIVQWTINGIPICTAKSDQIDPEIIADGSNGSIIVWEDSRRPNPDIYAQRINSTGDILWTPNGVIICSASGVQQDPELCTDGNFGAFVTWQDERSYSDIYGQWVNLNGTINWTKKGAPICTADGAQGGPKICSDGAGGAIVTWYDERAGTGNRDIYAQRITNGTYESQGNPLGLLTLPVMGMSQPGFFEFIMNPIVLVSIGAGVIVIIVIIIVAKKK